MFKKLKTNIGLWLAERIIKKLIKENKMISSIVQFLDGKKTYLFALGWMVYKVGVSAGWFPENPTIETLLLGGGAVALREGVTKAGK